jgi:anti-sigma factor RsiW
MDEKFDNRPAAEEGPAARHLTPEQLTAYLDGDVTTGERVRMDDHLRTCRDCRRELTELRATVVVLNRLPQYRPRRSFQLTPERIAAMRPWWERFGFRLLPALPALRVATVAAAILLVAVSAGGVIRERSTNQPAPPQAAFVQPTAMATNQAPGVAGPTSTAGVIPPPAAPRSAGGVEAAKSPTRTVQAAAVRPAPVTQTAEPESGSAFGAGVAEVTSAPSGNEQTAAGSFGGDTSGKQETSGTTAQSDGVAAPAAAAAATETPGTTNNDTAQAAMTSVPREAATTSAPTSGGAGGRSAASNKAVDEGAASEATSAPSPSPTPSPTASPTEVPATPTLLPATPSPTAQPATPTAIPATPVTDARQGAEGGGGISGWRVAQIGLALLLFWLAVTVIGLQRLRGRR